MNTRILFLLIFVLYIAGFVSHAVYLEKTAYGDGIFYYSWLRSAVVDRDADFKNEYRFFGVTQPETSIGRIGNKYSIGPAILWLPAFLSTRLILRGSGYEFGYQFAIGLASVCYALTGLVLLYRALLRYFKPDIARFSTAGIALATNLFFYGALDTVSSHAHSFFAAALFLQLVTVPKKNWWAIGASLGLIGLIRPQDIIYGLLLVPIADRRIWKSILAATVAFFPQLAAWQTLYGTVLVHPYFLSGEKFLFHSPHIAQVLFSQANGLLLWTPILLFAILGFFLTIPRDFTSRIAALCVVLLSVYVVASWSTWWQGASYSGRMFVSILPLFAVGLANFLSRATDWVGGDGRFPGRFVGLFTVLNVFLILVFLLSAP